MRALALITVAGLIGVSTVACTEDGYYNNSSSGYYNQRTQYVYQPGYQPGYYSSQPTYYYGSQYSARQDYDRDGVPNWRDQRPNNPYRY